MKRTRKFYIKSLIDWMITTVTTLGARGFFSLGATEFSREGESRSGEKKTLSPMSTTRSDAGLWRSSPLAREKTSGIQGRLWKIPIELEFSNVNFCGQRKTGEPREIFFRARTRINNSETQSTYDTGSRFWPRSHWCKASALTTAAPQSVSWPFAKHALSNTSLSRRNLPVNE